ncbi:MAG TPA: aminotransferase class V-fold PLP-dependent enzyme [Gemmatimonadaceae bacterium]|jgi:cysteine desulfurase/selenocysteine lyase
MSDPASIDVAAIREHFLFPRSGRVVTNNAASTQPPAELVDLYRALAPDYENVHRGQSDASKVTTLKFESAYDDIARFINAPSMRSIIAYRNTTEANNAVMYSLMTEFRGGDNVVTTMMEHNSNYVPWYGLCREILPAFGVNVEYRLARFDPVTGELDLEHLASLIDERTKLVCCTGASNFFGTKNSIREVRALASASGYVQPTGAHGSYLLIDGAQLVPSSFVDVQALDVDFLSFSFHKILAPFGVGVLYARESVLASLRPFLYGGDMIATGRVTPDAVQYNELPWKFTAGTPNILGTIVSAQAIRLLLDFMLHNGEHRYFQTDLAVERAAVERAMGRVCGYTQQLTQRALERLESVPGLQVYGPPSALRRTPLVSFNVRGHNPLELAEALNAAGVESRGGCHCATLAHHALKLDPPASCRLSFYVYNTLDEVDRATDSVARLV